MGFGSGQEVKVLGEEMLRRARSKGPCAGLAHLECLLEHPEDIPSDWEQDVHGVYGDPRGVGIEYLFVGTVLGNRHNGTLAVPRLAKDESSWGWHWIVISGTAEFNTIYQHVVLLQPNNRKYIKQYPIT